MAVIRLMLPKTFEESISNASFDMVGPASIPIAYLSDDVDKELLKQAMDWYVEESSAVDARISEIGRRFGEDEDALFVDFESTERPASGLNFILWLYDIDATVNSRLRTEIGTISKGAGIPSIRFLEEQMTLRDLSVVVGEEEMVYDLSIKHIGVREEEAREMAGNGLLVTEERRDVKGRICIEMKIDTQLKGGYPTIPLPSDITEGKDEVFITLPVGAFNAESLNGHTYRKTAMQDMLAQINERRPESNWGHLSEYEMGLRYNNPPVRWLAAMEQNGTIYALGRALTEESRTYYKRAKMDNARVGTSLFAWAETEGEDVTHLDLITIDLADPARVGVPLTAAKPHVVTTEMSKQEGNLMDEKKLRELLKLKDEDSIEVAVEAALAVRQEQATKVTELEKTVGEQASEIDGLKKTRSELVVLALDYLIENAVRIEENRPVVRELIAGVNNENLIKFENVEQVKVAVRDTLNRDSVKQLNRETLKDVMGQNQKRPSDTEQPKKHFNIPKDE